MFSNGDFIDFIPWNMTENGATLTDLTDNLLCKSVSREHVHSDHTGCGLFKRECVGLENE